jgi:hypothetical protein
VLELVLRRARESATARGLKLLRRLIADGDADDVEVRV